MWGSCCRFKIAENAAENDEIIRAGVEAAVVLEPVVRNIPSASLDRKQPNPDSQVLNYVRDKSKAEVSLSDLKLW